MFSLKDKEFKVVTLKPVMAYCSRQKEDSKVYVKYIWRLTASVINHGTGQNPLNILPICSLQYEAVSLGEEMVWVCMQWDGCGKEFTEG